MKHNRYISDATKQIQELLQGLDQSVVRQRPQGRGNVSFVTGEHVKSTMNRIFGHDGWSYSVTDFKDGERPRGPYARAIVELRVFFANGSTIERQDIGYGSASVKQSDGMELAGKEAVTDALKRCCASLGNQFGLSLYDKDNPLHSGGDDSHSGPATDDDYSQFVAVCDAGLQLGEPAVDALDEFLRSKNRPTSREMTKKQLSRATEWIKSGAAADHVKAWIESQNQTTETDAADADQSLEQDKGDPSDP